MIAASGKDKLEPRLLAMCMHDSVPENMMDILGDSGLTTVKLLKNTFVDDKEWRATLKLPPFDLSGADFATKLTIGKLASVYEAAAATNDVAVKADAERLRLGLAPVIELAEITQARKIFDLSLIHI